MNNLGAVMMAEQPKVGVSDTSFEQLMSRIDSVLGITEKFPGQGERVVLQKLVAGGKAPAHTHRGTETTIVLQGAFSDQKGVFNQWDFVVLNEEDEHKPVAVGCEDCIILSVLSAPLKLTGTFTRLLNPFIR